ncbi:hypothetical protein [Bacillus cereus]|uniref:hypothetical protein n=1 Tax=Bacillus cereus TaxID=1396 RepID=UPI0021125942|nr:hypothetical protein [Bacillus cereus]
MGEKTFDVSDINEFKELAKEILINRNSYEPWLRPVENGIKGERRTRKLLGNDFWLLDRDVDVNGGDLIIQRKNLKSDILGVDPLELGLVQVKFNEKINNLIYIDVKYLFDWSEIEDKLISLEGFFLLIHFDIGDQEVMFCLDSNDISALLEKKVIIGKKVCKDDTQKDIKKLNIAISISKLQKYFGRKFHNSQEIIEKLNKQLKELDYSKSVSKRFFVGRKPNLDNISREFEKEAYTEEIQRSILGVREEIYKTLLQSSDFVLYLKDLLRLHPNMIINQRDGELTQIRLLLDLKERFYKVGLEELENSLRVLKGYLESFEHPQEERYIEQYNSSDDEIRRLIEYYSEQIQEGIPDIVEIWHSFRQEGLIMDNYEPDNPELKLNLKELKIQFRKILTQELHSDFWDGE